MISIGKYKELYNELIVDRDTVNDEVTQNNDDDTNNNIKTDTTTTSSDIRRNESNDAILSELLTELNQTEERVKHNIKQSYDTIKRIEDVNKNHYFISSRQYYHGILPQYVTLQVIDQFIDSHKYVNTDHQNHIHTVIQLNEAINHLKSVNLYHETTFQFALCSRWYDATISLSTIWQLHMSHILPVHVWLQLIEYYTHHDHDDQSTSLSSSSTPPPSLYELLLRIRFAYERYKNDTTVQGKEFYAFIEHILINCITTRNSGADSV